MIPVRVWTKAKLWIEENEKQRELVALSFIRRTSAISPELRRCVSLRGPPECPHGPMWERERDRHAAKVDDGCLLLLTSWWIATGLCKCLVHRECQVRGRQHRQSHWHSLNRCANTSAFKCISSNCLFLRMSSLYVSALSSAILGNCDMSKNIPAEYCLGSPAGFLTGFPENSWHVFLHIFF